MKPGSPEWFKWFYSPQVTDPASVPERWHEDVVVNQSPEMPGTAGQFHGYEGLGAMFAELTESYTGQVWDPREVHRLDNGRYLVLLSVSARGRGSGIELTAEIAHIVTLRDDRVYRIDVHLGWDAGRQAAGLG